MTLIPTLKQAEKTKLFLDCDLLTRGEKRKYAKGLPSLNAQMKYFLWYLHFLGEYEMATTFLETQQSVLMKSIGVLFLNEPKKQLKELTVNCLDCEFLGKIKAKNKLDLVCPACKGIHLKFV